MSLGRGVGSELTFELDNWARPVETSVNERHIFWEKCKNQGFYLFLFFWNGVLYKERRNADGLSQTGSSQPSSHSKTDFWAPRGDGGDDFWAAVARCRRCMAANSTHCLMIARALQWVLKLFLKAVAV